MARVWNLDASLEDVETAIHSLDGSQCTLVVVELASGKTITIGGGPSKVVAELSENDTHRVWGRGAELAAAADRPTAGRGWRRDRHKERLAGEVAA